SNSRATVAIVKNAFLRWRISSSFHNSDKFRYKDFIPNHKYCKYVYEDLIEFAMKTRNMTMVLQLRDNNISSEFEKRDLYLKAFLTSIRYGNTLIFDEWFKQCNCVLKTTEQPLICAIKAEKFINNMNFGIH